MITIKKPKYLHLDTWDEIIAVPPKFNQTLVALTTYKHMFCIGNGCVRRLLLLFRSALESPFTKNNVTAFHQPQLSLYITNQSYFSPSSVYTMMIALIKKAVNKFFLDCSLINDFYWILILFCKIFKNMFTKLLFNFFYRWCSI